MHLTVSTQTAGVFEGLATLFTHIWPLACVLPQVVLVVRAPFESERAVGALECPNACVYLNEVNTGGKNASWHSVYIFFLIYSNMQLYFQYKKGKYQLDYVITTTTIGCCSIVSEPYPLMDRKQ